LQAQVRYRDLTRWDRAKEVLGQLFQAYVTGNLPQFRKQFSPGLGQEESIFTNAFLADHQQQTDLNLDLELLTYLESGPTMTVDLRWNRNATLKTSGLTQVDTGECRVYLDRAKDYLVRRMIGRLPFGLTDPELQKQARAGQVNLPPGTTLVPQVPNPPPASPLPPNGPIRLAINLNPAGKNVAAIDLTQGTVRRFQAAQTNLVTGQAGEDVAIFILPGSAPGATVHLLPLNGTQLGNCPQPVALTGLRTVLEANFPGVTSSLRSLFWAAKTGSGEYAFLQIEDAEGTRSPLSLAYFWTPDRAELNPSGSMDCPGP
jgi:hypothetical protein